MTLPTALEEQQRLNDIGNWDRWTLIAEARHLTTESARLRRLLQAIAKIAHHAPSVDGESNVEHAQRCPRCLADAVAEITLR